MKTKRSTFINRIFASVLAVVFLAACDASSIGGDEQNTDSLAESISFMVSDLSLSSSQASALSASMAKFGGDGSEVSREPGFLWRVAAELQATLSDEEKAALFERIEQAGQRDRNAGRMRPGGMGVDQMRQQGGPGGMQGGDLGQLSLTDDQTAAIEAIRESVREQIEAILAQRESLSREEIKSQLDEIHESVRSQIEALLTDDQRATLADLQAEREAARSEKEAERAAMQEAAKQVMIEVLALSPDQVAALDALRLEGESDRASIEEFIAAGATQEEVMEFVDSLRAAHQEALAAILDDVQLEITLIHNALSARMKQGGPHGGGPGQGGPGMNGAGSGRPNGGPGMRPGQGSGQGFGGRPGLN